MAPKSTALNILREARIAPEIFQLRPDYRALLMVIEGITPAASDAASEALLVEAEKKATDLLSATPVTELPHISAWRQTYKAFGAKPGKVRSSIEALTRRAQGGLPRVNRLTDIYNAISVKHQVPVGGEDLDRYDGSPFLIRATGEERFESFSGGESVVENAAPGEPIWCDGAGITCRRWNWRQGPRTALTDSSSRVLFILDALEPLSDEGLLEAAKELGTVLRGDSSDVEIAYTTISSSGSSEPTALS